VLSLDARRPAPPLGLGSLLLDSGYDAEPFAFQPGDRLLIYTDGVIEARDEDRTFYPLTERVTAWSAERPGPLLQHLRRDLLAHAGGRLGDDAAMVAVERVEKAGRIGRSGSAGTAERAGRLGRAARTELTGPGEASTELTGPGETRTA
jgi:hypothetical protein